MCSQRNKYFTSKRFLIVFTKIHMYVLLEFLLFFLVSSSFSRFLMGLRIQIAIKNFSRKSWLTKPPGHPLCRKMACGEDTCVLLYSFFQYIKKVTMSITCARRSGIAILVYAALIFSKARGFCFHLHVDTRSPQVFLYFNSCF